MHFLGTKMCKFLIKISPKFFLKGPSNNTSALVQIMAWCRPGTKPWSEQMMVSFLMHICITQPQEVNWCARHQTLSISLSLCTNSLWPISGWQHSCFRQRAFILTSFFLRALHYSSLWSYYNPWCASDVYTQDPDWVFTVPADFSGHHHPQS